MRSRVPAEVFGNSKFHQLSPFINRVGIGEAYGTISTCRPERRGVRALRAA